MGLDVPHGAFSGAYSAFNNLRRFLLRSIGGSWPPHVGILVMVIPQKRIRG